MDLKSCQVYLELAKSLHFGRTAELCNLSPSAVSRLIQRLEEQVGQALVERDNRHVSLTQAGRHFLEYARKSVDDWQQLRSDFSRNDAELSGEISVFGSVTASYSMLTQILPRLRESFPGVEIKLRTGDQADGIERVLAGSEECAIIALPDSLPARLEFLPLRTTPLKLVGPSMPSSISRLLDQCLADSQEPDWSSIPMVLAERGLARERLLEHLNKLNQQPHIYAQVAGHEAVVSMVSLGLGVALLPELVIQHSPIKHTIRELPWMVGLPAFRLGLCALQERLNDPLLKAFWECSAETHPQN
ncbi:MAG: LysR family positive regulator for ilvC [Parasphingorhabdus sp.]|jgi:LysR family positive regulator for ilvC